MKCKVKVIQNDNKEIIMTIDGKKVSVTWQDNDSVKALINILEENPLEIKATGHGGFEQVGAIGKTLPSNDKKITTKPGEIVLYSDDNIVLFYGSNTWAYTRLGTINASESELKELLGNKNEVIINLSIYS